jgi:hypothetical protein
MQVQLLRPLCAAQRVCLEVNRSDFPLGLIPMKCTLHPRRSFALVNVPSEFWVIAPVLAPLISRMAMLVAWSLVNF